MLRPRHERSERAVCLTGRFGKGRGWVMGHQIECRNEGEKRMRKSLRLVVLLGIMGVLLTPAMALAQVGNSGIAGQVRDTSGALMPGVTVEASSPALIEKVRTVVTNDQGQY